MQTLLPDLKQLEDKLFIPQALQNFLKAHSISQIIANINKTKKPDNIERISYLLTKIARGAQYKEYLNQCLQQQPAKQKQFEQFLLSDRSQSFFTLLANHSQDALSILDNHPISRSIFIKMLSSENGIKMIPILTKIYKNYPDNDALYSKEINQALREGLKHQNSETMMRYVEVIVEIASSTKGFDFIQGSGQSVLTKILDIYNTEDVLLKMNIVQVVSLMGHGDQTAELLKNHKIWNQIQKQAMDKSKQFYVRKYLLILVIDMAGKGHMDFSQKIKTDLTAFLKQCMAQKGQYIEGALELITHLFMSMEGILVVVGCNEIFEKFCHLARATEERYKVPYLDALLDLTSVGITATKKSVIINVLNCIGNPNLCGSASHNLHANNHMIEGLKQFSVWFTKYITQPFEDTQMRLLAILSNLSDYYDVSVTLFQNKDLTKYLAKKVSNIDNKLLKDRKAAVVQKLILKGSNQWKGMELQTFSEMLQKLIQNSAMEMQYAMDVE